MKSVYANNFFCFQFQTRNVGHKRPLEATKALSYFVSYTVPPETDTETFCSSKKGQRQLKTSHNFDDAISKHLVR